MSQFTILIVFGAFFIYSLNKLINSTYLRSRLRELSFLVVGTSFTLDGSLRTPRRDSLSCRGIELKKPLLLFLRWFRLLDLVSLFASRSTAWGCPDTSSIVVLDALVFTIEGTACFSSPSNFSHGEARSSSEIVSKLLGPTDDDVLSDIFELKSTERSTNRLPTGHFVTLGF